MGRFTAGPWLVSAGLGFCRSHRHSLSAKPLGEAELFHFILCPSAAPGQFPRAKPPCFQTSQSPGAGIQPRAQMCGCQPRGTGWGLFSLIPPAFPFLSIWVLTPRNEVHQGGMGLNKIFASKDGKKPLTAPWAVLEMESSPLCNCCATATC